MKNGINKGFSLLEMLLVLVIAVIFIIMSTRYYESYKKTRDIGLFQTSVSELMGALNQYYFMHCLRESNVFAGMNVKTLQDAGLVGGGLYNPWNNNQFTVQIVNPSSPGTTGFYVLRVTANINNVRMANYLRGALNADAGTGNVVTWTRLPLNTRDDLSSHQWILNQGPGQQFIALSKYATAVNTGTGSKFWILNSNLQSFANKYDTNYATNCPN